MDKKEYTSVDAGGMFDNMNVGVKGQAELVDFIFLTKFEPEACAKAYKIAKMSDAFRGDGARTIAIRTEHIHPCQKHISALKIIELFFYLQDNDMPGFPTGILVEDEFYLLDGHHRVSAAIMRGLKEINVKATEISKKIWDEAVVDKPVTVNKKKERGFVDVNIIKKMEEERRKLLSSYNGDIKAYLKDNKINIYYGNSTEKESIR